MVKNLSIKDLEKFVFTNKIIQAKLPKYKFLFDGWLVAQASPSLKSVATRCVLDFATLITEEDKKLLEEEFNLEINIVDLKHNSVKYYTTSVDKLENMLDDASNYAETVLFRRGKEIRVLLWR